jgi:hypothetical protein
MTRLISIGDAMNHQGLILLIFGGFKHFLFSRIYGIILPIDFHIFQRGGSTTNQYVNMGFIGGGKGTENIHEMWNSYKVSSQNG